MAAYRRRPLLSCHRIRSSPSTRGHKIRIVSDRFKFLEGDSRCPRWPYPLEGRHPKHSQLDDPRRRLPHRYCRTGGRMRAGAFRAAGTRAKDRLSSLRHETSNDRFQGSGDQDGDRGYGGRPTARAGLCCEHPLSWGRSDGCPRPPRPLAERLSRNNLHGHSSCTPGDFIARRASGLRTRSAETGGGRGSSTFARVGARSSGSGSRLPSRETTRPLPLPVSIAPRSV